MADKVWFGGAAAVPQVDTVTLGGTFAASETITLTINSKDLVLTLGTTVDLATVVGELYNMCTGTAVGSSGYSRNTTGDAVGEFAILAYAEDSVSKLTITGPSDGRPFTLTTSTDSVSGTVTKASVTTPTGPHHFSNVDNWGGSVPVDGDNLIFDHRGSSDLKYDISQTTFTPAKLTLSRGFEHAIGLPDVFQGTTNALNFSEFLETDFTFGDTADATITEMTVKIDAPTTSTRIRMNTQAKKTLLSVYGTGQRELDFLPNLLWKGTHASNTVDVYGGDVGIAVGDDETATVSALTVYGSSGTTTVQLGVSVTVTTTRVELGTVISDSSLGNLTMIGGTVTASAGLGDLDMSGGTATVTLASTLSAMKQTGGTLSINGTITTGDVLGGTCTLTDGGVTTLTIEEATFVYNGAGTCTTLVARENGSIDFSQDPRAKTVTTCQLHSRSSYKDPYRVVTHTNGIEFVQCAPRDLTTLQLPRNTKYVLTAL